jgi:3-deoxy-manno-octulosonate cytidylyltransferase (CMP-KDO synthetase)
MKYSSLPKSDLENVEKLEQLRIIENGYKIKCIKTDYESISIDVPEDLKKII